MFGSYMDYIHVIRYNLTSCHPMIIDFNIIPNHIIVSSPGSGRFFIQYNMMTWWSTRKLDLDDNPIEMDPFREDPPRSYQLVRNEMWRDGWIEILDASHDHANCNGCHKTNLISICIPRFHPPARADILLTILPTFATFFHTRLAVWIDSPG